MNSYASSLVQLSFSMNLPQADQEPMAPEGGHPAIFPWQNDIQSTTRPLSENRRHRCGQCGRTYSRRDHLARHFLSHSTQRSFVCLDCGKAFTRGDLLSRHSITHGTELSGQKLRSKFHQSLSRRVSKACSPCAAAKVKCHDEKPCRRCLKRGIPCTSSMAGRTAVQPGEERIGDGNYLVWHGSDQPSAGTSPFLVQGEMQSVVNGLVTGTQLYSDSLTGEEYPPEDHVDMSEPTVTPRIGACLGTSFEDFFPETFDFGGSWESLITTGKIRQASQAFESSLWYSTPDATKLYANLSPSHQFIDEESQDLLRTAHPSNPQSFDQCTRDNLLINLVNLAQKQPPEYIQSLRRAFPSPELLSTLVHSFFWRQDRKIDPWIHSATFRPSSDNLELTAMILAASTFNASSPALRQLGSILHRLLRPVIIDKIENDRNACQLQLHQAFLIYLELDLWHNENGCLHRAGRFSGIISTFLRRELRDKQPGSITIPLITDHPAELASKWTLWVIAESYRRLMTRFCVYDNQLSMTLGVKSSMTFSEYRIYSPQPKELWLARNATKWQQLSLSEHVDYTPRVMDLFASMPTITIAEGFLDKDLAMKLIFHILGGLIMEYQLSGQMLQGTTRRREEFNGPTSIQSRRIELEAAIRSYEHVFNSDICASNIGSLVVSYLSMTLRVSIENIEILAGKGGEQESRQMYQIMTGWPETTGAREAIWDAGQILRHFRLLDRLTSFQIIIAYHAGLVLFAYSVLSCVQGRAATVPEAPMLYLNGTSFAQVEVFIREGSAEPMLQGGFRGTERASASLLATKDAVDIISETILNRSSSCEELSPRLVNGLVKLLKELGVAMQILQNDFHLSDGFDSGLAQDWT